MTEYSWREFLNDVVNGKECVKGLETYYEKRKQEEQLMPQHIPTFIAMFDENEPYAVLPQNKILLGGVKIPVGTLKTHRTAIYSAFGLTEKDKNENAKDPHRKKGGELWMKLYTGYQKLKKEKEAEMPTGKVEIDEPTLPIPTQIQPPATPQIDWLDRSHQLLTAQKHLTTNRLLNNSNRNFDNIHVPLGLIERKKRPKVKEEPSPERGSELYQTEYTKTKRFEHEAFLAEVVRNRVASKHIAIIGEPGAGKTTILTKIGEYLIRQAQQQPEQPFVVAWVSLAAVGDRPLQSYLKDEWLQKVCEDDFDAAWKEWRELRQQGRVWLLLDGLDEMSGDALGSIYRDLGQAWAQNLRVVMTCRINQWEAAAGGNILTNSFDVYRTLDYSYQTSQGEDQVGKFISNWFGDKEKEVANQIRRELDAPGKERIKDLVKNPLRLTLLCASWEQDHQALPETQADLYRGFVNYLYRWKASEFKEEVKLKDKLNLALGELAKAGLNRASINDGAVRRFRFTASEISKLWQDLPDTLLPAAEKLGWLNVVGEEANEDLYAFYHPTFQEYFAACSIDDWDYFLPRAHVDRPIPFRDEDAPTYRVFENQWQQIVLLWIGRSDLNNHTNNFKENFLQKLTDFSGEEDFAHYQAYCMAGIFISEFKSSKQSKKIIEQIITWSFGYFNENENKWQIENRERIKQNMNENEVRINDLARQTIPLIHHEYIVIALANTLWNNGDLDIRNEIDIIRTILRIDKENTKAIEYLMAIFGSSDPDWNIDERDDIYAVMEVVKEFNIKHPVFIQELIKEIFFSYYYIDDSSVAALIKIAKGDLFTIAHLIKLLHESECKNKLKAVCKVLSEIAKNSYEASKYLIKILSMSYSLEKKIYTAIILGKIEKRNLFAKNFLDHVICTTTAEEKINYLAKEALKGIDEDNFHESVDTIFERMNSRFNYDF